MNNNLEQLLKVENILLKEENQALREQLVFFEAASYKHVGADVVGRNIDPIGTTIVINEGIEAGIVEGNAVIVDKGLLIGKVIKVHKNTSIVRLLNDRASRVAATLLNRDKSIGLVEGGYGLSVGMDFIPQNENITQGDIVTTSGLEAGVPRGLLIGEVEVVEKKPQEPFQRAVLTPAADLKHITVVSVIVHEVGSKNNSQNEQDEIIE